MFFVTYRTPDAVEKALQLSGTTINNTDVAVSRRIEGRENDPQPGEPRKVFVGRLAKGMDGAFGCLPWSFFQLHKIVIIFSLSFPENRLLEIFGKSGPLVEIDLARNRRFALITFENPTAAQAALALNGQEFDGRKARQFFFFYFEVFSRSFLSCPSFPSILLPVSAGSFL